MQAVSLNCSAVIARTGLAVTMSHPKNLCVPPNNPGRSSLLPHLGVIDTAT